MRIAKPVALLVLLTFLGLSVRWFWFSDSIKDANDVRARVFQAYGGFRFDRPVTLHRKAIDDSQSHYDFRLTFDAKGRLFQRREYHDDRIPDATMGYDGQEAWRKSASGLTEEVTGRSLHWFQLLNWMTIGNWSHPECPVEVEIDDEHAIRGEVALYVRPRDFSTREEQGDDEDLEDGGGEEEEPEIQCRVVVDRRTWLPKSYQFDSSVVHIREYQKLGEQSLPKVEFTDSATAVSVNGFEIVGSDGPIDWSRPPSSVEVETGFSRDLYLQCRSQYTKMFVRPNVNGKELGWFLFDSGAYRTRITPAALAQLGDDLPILGIAYGRGVGTGVTKSSVRMVDSLELGTLKLGNWIVNVGDLPIRALRDSDGPNKVVGLIGSDVMSQCVVTYDLQNTRIQLHDRYVYRLPYGEWLPLAGTDFDPRLAAKVDGVDGLFCVDTGASGLFLSQRATNRMDLAKESDRYQPTAGFGGGVTAYASELRKLEFGEFVFKDVPATLADDERGGMESMDVDGLIGAYILNQFRVVFDVSGRRIAFLSL